MLTWEFFLNDVQVPEPTGWDAAGFTLQRSDKFTGLENLYSDVVTFDHEGGTILKNIFTQDGIDGVVSVSIKGYCNGVLTDEIKGVINLITYKEINGEVSVRIDDTSFVRTFKNRLSTVIDLSKAVGIDGGAITDYQTFSLGLHSKKIVEKSSMNQNDELLVVEEDTSFAPAQNTPITVYFPLALTSTELETAIEIDDFFHINELAPSVSPVFTLQGTGGVVKFDYKLKGTWNEAVNDLRSYGFVVVLSHGTDGGQNIVDLTPVTSFSQNGGTTTVSFDIAGSVDINLNTGESIYIRIAISNYSTTNVTPQPVTFSLTSDAENFLNFTQSTVAAPSVSNAYLLHEVFQKVCESLTGIPDCFRSDFFGRTNSLPAYDQNGCGAFIALTNGLNIRNMLDKNGNAYPIITSFQELFDSLDAIHNLGMGIETINGKQYIRVEPKEYFYNTDSIMLLENVADIETTVAPDLYYNQFEVGYEKWNLNITGVNAIDEINTKHIYSIPVVNAKNKLTAICKYITAGYVIEQTRRIQYLTKPTNDFETDNDNFLIACNRISVYSSLYNSQGIATTYLPGTVSERDELFTDIDNLLDSETVYNLRLSPVAMAMNWYKVTSACLVKKASQEIKFTSGEGNILEGHKLVDTCGSTIPVVQNQNIERADLQGIPSYPLYQCQYMKFSYPLKFNEFLTLINNSKYSLDISCNNGNFRKGFIKEIVYRPNQDGAGIADLILLEAICTGGGFDSEAFDTGFDIGNC
jgi:hypothetical protein